MDDEGVAAPKDSQQAHVDGSRELDDDLVGRGLNLDRCDAGEVLAREVGAAVLSLAGSSLRCPEERYKVSSSALASPVRLVGSACTAGGEAAQRSKLIAPRNSTTSTIPRVQTVTDPRSFRHRRDVILTPPPRGSGSRRSVPSCALCT